MGFDVDEDYFHVFSLIANYLISDEINPLDLGPHQWSNIRRKIYAIRTDRRFSPKVDAKLKADNDVTEMLGQICVAVDRANMGQPFIEKLRYFQRTLEMLFKEMENVGCPLTLDFVGAILDHFIRGKEDCISEIFNFFCQLYKLDEKMTTFLENEPGCDVENEKRLRQEFKQLFKTDMWTNTAVMQRSIKEAAQLLYLLHGPCCERGSIQWDTRSLSLTRSVNHLSELASVLGKMPLVKDRPMDLLHQLTRTPVKWSSHATALLMIHLYRNNPNISVQYVTDLAMENTKQVVELMKDVISLIPVVAEQLSDAALSSLDFLNEVVLRPEIQERLIKKMMDRMYIVSMVNRQISTTSRNALQEGYERLLQRLEYGV